jgi:hypothetical protein
MSLTDPQYVESKFRQERVVTARLSSRLTALLSSRLTALLSSKQEQNRSLLPRRCCCWPWRDAALGMSTAPRILEVVLERRERRERREKHAELARARGL